MLSQGGTTTANTYPNVMKYDYCFKTADGYKINASLLYNENNPLANYLIAQFTDLMNLF